MKKTMIVFLILSASAAGICFASSNTASNQSLSTMDNSDNSTNGTNNY